MTAYEFRLRAIVAGDERLDSARNRREIVQEFGVTSEQLERDLRTVSARLEKLPLAVFCCAGPNCCRNRAILPERAGIPVVETACLGPCKQAPVVKLKLHQQEQMFARVDSQDKAEQVMEFSERVSHKRSLMVDPGRAQELFYDPHHPAAQPSELVKLGFLIGRFRGEGRMVETGESFVKEVEGRWEAGGRYISLRQRAAYGEDVHSATVMVGALRATAFRDDGTEQSYHPRWDGDTLLFEDRLPHRARARAARKRLLPLQNGYRETLEITRDGVTYQPYYIIEHKKEEAVNAKLSSILPPTLSSRA